MYCSDRTHHHHIGRQNRFKPSTHPTAVSGYRISRLPDQSITRQQCTLSKRRNGRPFSFDPIIRPQSSESQSQAQTRMEQCHRDRLSQNSTATPPIPLLQNVRIRCCTGSRRPARYNDHRRSRTVRRTHHILGDERVRDCSSMVQRCSRCNDSFHVFLTQTFGFETSSRQPRATRRVLDSTNVDRFASRCCKETLS